MQTDETQKKEPENKFGDEFLKKHLTLKERIDQLQNSIKLNHLFSNHLVEKLKEAEKERHELILELIEEGGLGMGEYLDMLIKIYSTKNTTVCGG